MQNYMDPRSCFDSAISPSPSPSPSVKDDDNDETTASENDENAFPTLVVIGGFIGLVSVSAVIGFFVYRRSNRTLQSNYSGMKNMKKSPSSTNLMKDERGQERHRIKLRTLPRRVRRRVVVRKRRRAVKKNIIHINTSN